MNEDLIIGSHVGFNSTKQLLGSVEEAISLIVNTWSLTVPVVEATKLVVSLQFSPLSIE